MNEDGEAALAYPIAFAAGDGSDPDALIDMPAAVVSSVPEAGASDVSADLGRIEVTFSKDMDDGVEAWIRDEARTWPDVVDSGFSDARTAWLDVALQPSTTYAIWVGREGDAWFEAADGTEAQAWLLTFRTAP